MAFVGILNKLINYIILPFLIFFFLAGYGLWPAILGAILYYASIIYFKRPRIYAALGTANYHKGNLTAALNMYRKAYTTGKATPTATSSYAYILLKTGQVHEAETVLNALLYKSISTDEKLYAKSILALVLWKKGQLEDGAVLLEEVMEQYKTTSIYGSYGYLLILKGDLEKALKLNLEAYEYNNSDPVILDNLGQTYYLLDDLHKAKQIYAEVEKLNPQFQSAWYNYALVLMKTGENEKALECLKKAQGFEPSYLSNVTADQIQTALEEVEKRLGNIG